MLLRRIAVILSILWPVVIGQQFYPHSTLYREFYEGSYPVTGFVNERARYLDNSTCRLLSGHGYKFHLELPLIDKELMLMSLIRDGVDDDRHSTMEYDLPPLFPIIFMAVEEGKDDELFRYLYFEANRMHLTKSTMKASKVILIGCRMTPGALSAPILRDITLKSSVRDYYLHQYTASKYDGCSKNNINDCPGRYRQVYELDLCVRRGGLNFRPDQFKDGHSYQLYALLDSKLMRPLTSTPADIYIQMTSNVANSLTSLILLPLGLSAQFQYHNKEAS